MSYRSAKRWYSIRYHTSVFLDRVMTAGAAKLGMCGEGPKNGWSVLFSQMFYTECPCCNFYRGVTVGAVLTLTLSAPVFVILGVY